MVVNSRALKNMQKRKEDMVLAEHPYAITSPPSNGTKPRWQTYVKEGGKRKILRSTAYDDLIEKLYQFYFVQNGLSPLTMEKLFYEWLSYKESITNSIKTIRRHEQHWRKYFTALKSEKISSYDRLELQRICNLLVKENNLTSKEWQNIKTILSGMFSYASEKGYINENIMKDIRITVRFRQVNKKTGKTETYQTDELKAIMNYLDREIEQTGDAVCLAIKFDFYLGCRVGELVALKWCDCIDLQRLHIRREELKESFRGEDGKWHDFYTVVEHTKTGTDRIVPIVPSAIGILNNLRLKRTAGTSDDDFIFVRDGKRITSRQVNYALEKACNSLGIPVKRSHKIRKTVASRLNAANVPLDSIREMLGHSNLNTTLSYIFNPLTEKETYSLMTKAL